MNKDALSKLYFQEDPLVAAICRRSFYRFVQEFWDVVITEDPVWNWHIEYLCGEFQALGEKVFRGERAEYDLLVNICPGTTKSTIASVMFPAWCWTRMPTCKIITASYGATLSNELSRKSRQVIESEKYQRCFGIKLTDDQNQKEYYENSAGGARKAVGIGGAIVGFHAHIILIDDPIDPKGSFSPAKLKDVDEWMTNTIPFRKINKEVTATALIMQRLHIEDPSAKMEERGKGRIRKICLPAELTEKVYPLKLRRYYRDGLLDPVRLPRRALEEIRRNGDYAYNAQMLQDPIPAGDGMFKWDLLKIDTPQWNKFVRLVRYWDKAGTAGAGAYTAGVLMGLDRSGRFWILDVVRGQWDSGRREQIIKATAEKEGTGIEIGIEQEPGSGGKESAENTVRNLAGYRVRVNRPTGDKILRADPYSVQVNNGNVSLSKGDWNHAYIHELTYFPFSTFKDQVDASSGAFSLLNKARKKVGGWR